jgi:integrase
VNAPKSIAGNRTIGIPLALKRKLKEHIESTRFDALPNEYVFVSLGGGPLRYTNFRSRVFGPACKRLGFTNTTFHDLRRFNATVMVGAGVDLKTAQVRLGHADPRLTLALYAQVTTVGDLAAVGALEKSIEIIEKC